MKTPTVPAYRKSTDEKQFHNWLAGFAYRKGFVPPESGLYHQRTDSRQQKRICRQSLARRQIDSRKCLKISHS